MAKWNPAYFHADAHLFFESDTTANAVRMIMKSIPELNDIIYCFQDLAFKITQ